MSLDLRETNAYAAGKGVKKWSETFFVIILNMGVVHIVYWDDGIYGDEFVKC
jgi:hypothetical protein